MIRAFLFLAFIVAACNANAVATSKSVSASIKETKVDGLEGLNLKLAFPFKFDDYVIGFKTTLTGNHKAPETLFAKKTFATNVKDISASDGTATVEADFNTRSNVLSVAAKWVSDALGATVRLDGNSRDNLEKVGLSTSRKVDGKNVGVDLEYDVKTEHVDATASVAVDDTAVEVSYNTKDKNPTVAVSRKIDSNNQVSPSISLKDGSITYKWTRALKGGKLESTLHPGDKVIVDWTDNGSDGAWKTSAEIPLEDRKNAKVSITRDWAY